MKYEEKKFNIGKLEGVSEKTVSEHLKLYAGYVKHVNLILEKAYDLVDNPETEYAGREMQRRFGFEWNGMRNHEIYFSLLENGQRDLTEDGELKKAIEKRWGTFETWLVNFKKLAGTRGPGWVMLCQDAESGELLNIWAEEHHIGLLNGVKTVLVLDMWEHAFLSDYATADKMKYVEAFFANLNWSVAEKLFANAK